LNGDRDDEAIDPFDNNAAIASDSSTNASARTSGEPTDILRHATGSHIQRGTLRETCESSSTSRSIPSRRFLNEPADDDHKKDAIDTRPSRT
jgi:hypothetical protein